MTDERLAQLYRKLSARTDAIDAERVAGLAQGATDPQALAAVARSAAAADALRLAMALEADAAAIAAAVNGDAVAPGRQRIAHQDRSHLRRAAGGRSRRARQWAALAAAVAFGFAAMLQHGPVGDATPRMTSVVAPTADRILAVDFEATPDVAAPEAADDDALFVDDFGA